VFISNGYQTKRNKGERKTKWVYGKEGMGHDFFFLLIAGMGVGIFKKKG
jgi:hypothetical protein